jgi:thiosulfate/3-mercaptopyruvate sulfurtransferase
MRTRSALFRAFLLPLWVIAVFAAVAFATAPSPAKPADDLPQSGPQVIQPEELARWMKAADAEKPVVLYVGPKAFYLQAHSPGAENIGPVAKPEGMEKLRARAVSLPKNGPVVIYCGCCHWDHCPNIRPAFAELKKMGLTRVRVLYLATSFGANWAEKGLPIAKGE